MLDKLIMENISALKPLDGGGAEYEIAGEILRFEAEGAVVCHALPAFRNNRGFYHIFESGGEAILLKGVYGDLARVIKKGITLDESRFEQLARLLNAAAKALGEDAEYWVLSGTDENYIVKASAYTVEEAEKPDPSIPRPLTGAEYTDAQTGNADTTLFSKGFLYNLFPETISQFTATLAKNFPEILSAFFMAFDAKVGSPSLICSGLRLYTNITAFLPGFREAHINPALFAEDYMPWQKLFKSYKAPKPELFISSLMEAGEIDSFITDIEKEIRKKGTYAFFETDYFAPLSSISLMGVLLNFLFQEQVAYLGELSDMRRDDILRAVYTTRATSFFAEGKTINLPKYFDLSYPQEEVILPGGAEIKAPETFLQSLPTLRRWRKGKQIMKVLNMAHGTLDARDRLLLCASSFHKVIYDAIAQNGSYVVNRKKFKDPMELTLFNLQDMRRLVNDTYYSGLDPILDYKRGYKHRSAAQCMPYEVYEADIPYSGMIAEEQIYKAMEAEEFLCFSRGHKENVTVRPLSLQDAENGGAVCARAFNLAHIPLLKEPSAIITELAPAFSYITEYCILKEIPLYYGIRYSESVLSNKTLELHADRCVLNA